MCLRNQGAGGRINIRLDSIDVSTTDSDPLPVYQPPSVCGPKSLFNGYISIYQQLGALGTIVLLDAGLGESASRLSAITDTLLSRPGARTIHVVMLGEGERLSPQELRGNLSLIDEANLFLLPTAGSKDPVSLLRSLFARIVP